MLRNDIEVLIKGLKVVLLIVFVSLHLQCEDDNIEPDPLCEFSLDSITIIQPQPVAPLCAKLKLKYYQSNCSLMSVSINVQGHNGSEDYRYEVPLDSIIPIYGLYEDHNNQVEVQIADTNFIVEILTQDIEHPNIVVNTPSSSAGFISIFNRITSDDIHQPTAFDKNGNLRWVVDFGKDSILTDCFSHIKPTIDGNLVAPSIWSEEYILVEFDYFGNVTHIIPKPEVWTLHHDMDQKPNGNYVVLVENAPTRYNSDIAELDRNGNIVNFWDTDASLKSSRFDYYPSNDWLHLNSVDFDESDNTIVISGKNGACAKLDNDNKVVWILSPHGGYNNVGWESEFQQYLLHPIDDNGNFLPQNVADGLETGFDGFEWPYQHHSAQLNGNKLLIFDNGFGRHFIDNANLDNYSRVVEYTIDPVNKTIRQDFEYGKNRLDLYSNIVSTVDKTDDSYLMCSGIAGKIVEVSKSGTLIFDATIITNPVVNPLIKFYSAYYFKFPV